MSTLIEQESIAESTFNSFYSRFVDGGYDTSNILFNFLPEFVKEVAHAWSEKCSLMPYSTVDKINGSSPLFELIDYNNVSTRFVITESGVIYTADTVSIKTGGATWNGDDMYYDEYKTNYINIKKIGVIENIASLNETTTLTTEMMEMMAGEIVSTICQ